MGPDADLDQTRRAEGTHCSIDCEGREPFPISSTNVQPSELSMNLKTRLIFAAFASTLAVAAAHAADGAAIATNNQCMACHSLDKKLLGPSFKEIAAKYKSDTSASDQLVASVKNGSKGKWGPMAMPPNRLSDEDAHTVVAWILTQ
jgi:cytochrome c